MRLLRLAVCVVLGGLAAVGAGPVPAGAGQATVAVPTLVAIRASHHPGFDRVVYQFEGGLPAEHQVRYVDRLVGDASGLPVRIAGRAVLAVSFSPARAHEDGVETAPARTAFALPNVMTTVRAGDFEAVTTYGIGLAKRTRFQVFTMVNPSRVVIDVRAAFPTVNRKVYFFDVDNFVDNREPFFVATTRPVRPESPAVGVMDRLFAGPVGSERRQGLRLLRSHAVSFAGPVIAAQVARVRLTGGCDSDGSTVTIAGEIMPTLRQFPSVDWVKIFDPAGTTGDPTGPSDSIPACLEP